MKAFGWTIMAACLAVASLPAQEAPATPRQAPARRQAMQEPPLKWRNVKDWGVEGRAFADMERKAWFDRLPATA